MCTSTGISTEAVFTFNNMVRKPLKEHHSTPASPPSSRAPRPPTAGYESCVIRSNMRIGERGQVTIPKEIRDQFGLGPETEVEFHVMNGAIVLKKAPKKLNLAKWKGRCGGAFAKLSYTSVTSSSRTFAGDDHGHRHQHSARHSNPERRVLRRFRGGAGKQGLHHRPLIVSFAANRVAIGIT
jgi:AbrB family looped-hinge helix DNA binding protein